MIDFGEIIDFYFPDYGWLLIDMSHIILGYLAGIYPSIIILFIVYQVFDIKEEDNLNRDIFFFGIGYATQKLLQL